MANSITITGNLAGDPELKFTPSGDAVANFTVCDTPRRFNKQTNEWEDAGDTLFLRCAIWREHAEWAAETLTKGQRVTVTGRIKQRDWQDNDGNKRTSVECDADSIAPHPRKQAQGNAWGGQQASQAPPQQQSAGWGQQPPQSAPQPQQQAMPTSGGWGGAPTYDEPPF